MSYRPVNFIPNLVEYAACTDRVADVLTDNGQAKFGCTITVFIDFVHQQEL
jgi:hypothetical protein